MDNNSTSAPLADYFWIAGIDSLQYGPEVSPSNTRDRSSNIIQTPPSPQVDATIEESPEGENSPPPNSNRASARHSRNNSWNRLSKQSSHESRSSISTLDELEGTASNRSSMTIKAGEPDHVNGLGNDNRNGNGNGNATKPAGGGLFGNFDFDKALLKFANERENFLDDLSFSAGVPTQAAPPMTNPRASRLRVEDAENVQRRSPTLRSVGGSIRRRISFRDLNSMKRQPSMAGRSSKSDILHPAFCVPMRHIYYMHCILWRDPNHSKP